LKNRYKWPEFNLGGKKLASFLFKKTKDKRDHFLEGNTVEYHVLLGF